MELFDLKVTYISRPFRALSSHTLGRGSLLKKRTLSKAVGQESIGFPSPIWVSSITPLTVLEGFSSGFAR